MRLSDSKHMYDADNAAIHACGIPSTLLMRNAAGHVARAAFGYTKSGGTAFVFCGSGNNGGDGVAAALYLLRWGVGVRVLLTGSRGSMTEDTREMERRLIECGGRVEDFDPEAEGLREALGRADVIIDAIFGIGLNKEVRGRALAAIRLINESGVPVVSADIPSGVEADTGRVLGECVRAAKTVTFSMAKTGHFAEPGCVFTGKLEIADIGIPAELLARSATDNYALMDGEVTLPRRRAISHKGDYGKLLILGGCRSYTGAPTLCARAAVRSGAGLVWLGVPAGIYALTAAKNDEAMPFALPDAEGGLAYGAAAQALKRLDGCDVCAIGPGLGRGEETVRAVRELIRQSPVPLVIDADGLHALAQDMDILRRTRAPVILTPHEAEFARIGGVLSGDRTADARAFARTYGCTLVLKGHRTLAAYPDGEVYIATHGNAGMAKGGSGDVLTGILAAMLGQLPHKRAVNTAVFLHGLAGDLCCREKGEYSMTATDVIETLPAATKMLIEQEQTT